MFWDFSQEAKGEGRGEKIHFPNFGFLFANILMLFFFILRKNDFGKRSYLKLLEYRGEIGLKEIKSELKKEMKNIVKKL